MERAAAFCADRNFVAPRCITANKSAINLTKNLKTVLPMPSPDMTLSSSENPLSRKRRWPGIIALLILAIICLLVFMRVFGLLMIFSVPTTAMAPAVNRNDIVLMEGLSYLARQPRRGEIIVFKTEGIHGIANPPGVSWQYYFKRVAGEPGDRVRITGNQLFINDHPVTLTNQSGAIHYTSAESPHVYLKNESDTAIIPADCYFVLGDNSPNSSDSRYWGPVPANNIKGRIIFH